MSLTKQVAELYEGGYWYTLPAVPETDEFGDPIPGTLTLPDTITAGWCATYAAMPDGETYAAFRKPNPVDVNVCDYTVQEVLAASAAQGSQLVTEKHQWRVEGN